MLIIDRFEGEYAVIEDTDRERFNNVDKALLPANAREGDVVEERGGNYIINVEETKKRREKIIERLNRLFGKNP